jgi:hypothetical protein
MRFEIGFFAINQKFGKKTEKLIEWDSFVHPSEKMEETGQRKRQSKPWVANLKDKKEIVKKEREKRKPRNAQKKSYKRIERKRRGKRGE